MENAAVIHKVYGRGIVTAREEKTIRIQFEREGVGEKSFVYPDAFCSFLQFEDGQLMSQVRKELETIRLAEEERVRERAAERAAYLEEEKQRQKKLAAVKRKSAAKRPVRTVKKESADDDE